MREGLMDDTGYQFDEYEPSEEDIIYHMGAKDLEIGRASCRERV